jgi:hypothetical protein
MDKEKKKNVYNEEKKSKTYSCTNAIPPSPNIFGSLLVNEQHIDITDN